LEKKVAIVTGGSAGIGKESCLLFAQEGASVVVADIDEKGGKQTVDEIKKQGGQAVFVKTDVSSAKDNENMVKTAEKTYGKLNILFLNAGIMHSNDDNAMTTEEDVWDLTMRINLKSIFLGCKFGIPALKRAGGGSILYTASFVAILGASTPQLAYTAS
jgi:NAD(P)-dependent dehydrogenase (short-subunit alcohol dehydrogenase family)